MPQTVLEFRVVVKRFGTVAAVDKVSFSIQSGEIFTLLGPSGCTELLRIQDDEEWNCFYDAQAASLEAKPYPTLEAIQNVFALALKRDPEIKNFNPLALWDLHYLREIDDSGYINRLYG